MNYYQIQTKFRDEIRPRFGVMRGREFLMKDAYSFHIDEADLVREYQNMRATYTRIFTRVGVEFRAVKADSGAIGGDRSEEFHVLANSGEDLLAVSDQSNYAANIEAAETRSLGTRAAASSEMREIVTPDQKSCEEVASFLGVPLKNVLKLLIYKDRRGFVFAVALRGDHTLNEVKLDKFLGSSAPAVRASDEDIKQVFQCEPGFLGPTNRSIPRVIADHAAAHLTDFICGANRTGYHLVGANWGRDAAEPETADLRNAIAGDPSPDGQGSLKLVRGIEVGHIFQLGQLYTNALKMTVLDADGREVTPEMGCYGIGVTRIVAAVIEQRNDDKGILWPDAIAPFRVLLCPIGTDKSAAAKAAAEKLYEDLLAAGVEVLLDDRGLRPGPMFADADLIGIPHRIVIGEKGLAQNQFEYKRRDAAAVEMIPATVDAVLERLQR
ncbi:MAG: proline--tRNA ligase [Nevskia sp.]|nr:proline--tRNA ligase [Nevskia sp.]